MELESPPQKTPLLLNEKLTTPWRTWWSHVYEKLRGPLWEENIAEMVTGKPGGGGLGTPGGPTVVNGGPYQAYTFTPGDAVNLAFHIKHDIKPNSKIYPHVHWTTNGTASGNAVWRIHYQIAKGHDQEAFPTATTMDITGSTSGTAWQHYITEASNAQAIDAPEVDSLVLVSVELESDTISDTIFGLYVDLHYQKDRFGTPQKAPNFYERGKS